MNGNGTTLAEPPGKPAKSEALGKAEASFSQLSHEQKQSLFDQAIVQAEANVLNARINLRMAEAGLAALLAQAKES